MRWNKFKTTKIVIQKCMKKKEKILKNKLLDVMKSDIMIIGVYSSDVK